MFWAPWIICDFIKLVWTNSNKINSNPFEFNSNGFELQPQILETYKWFKNHWNVGKAQIFGYAKFWGWRGILVSMENSNSDLLSLQVAFEFKFKSGSNTEFHILSPHENTSPSIMQSLRHKRWSKITWWIGNACGLLHSNHHDFRADAWSRAVDCCWTINSLQWVCDTAEHPYLPGVLVEDARDEDAMAADGQNDAAR